MLSLYRKWGKIAGLGVVLAALLVGVAACAPAPTPEATATPAPEATPTPVPEATPTPVPVGGDLVVAMDGSGEPALLDSQIDPYIEAQLITSFLTDSLVCRDPETMGFKPWLATDWEVSEDGLTWTFHLRKDVKFHDGTPFNAEAVKYNIERILAPETASVMAAERLRPVKSVEVVDEYTVAITTEKPYAAFLDALSSFQVPMWSPTAVEKYGLKEFPLHLVGTGPFIFKENVPKDHVTVVRNPDYNWAPACVDHTGPAYLDSLTFKWISEEAVLGGIVKTGEAQVTHLPAQYVSDYEGDPNYEVVIGHQPGTGLQWVMNTDMSPLDDISVRKAILHAIDRDSINQMLYAGRYLVYYGPLTQYSMCYWKGAETIYPYDPEKANALLDEAGWKMNPATGIREKDGQPLKIRWTCIHHEEIGEALAAQLKEIGIDLIPEKVAGPVQIDLVTRRDFDLMYERQQEPDPSVLDWLWNSKNAGPGGWAWTGFKDERLDESLDKANEETDPDKRCEYYVEAQKIIMENALQLGMLGQPIFWVVDKSVKGFELGALPDYFYPYNLRFEK
ncbi:MAG: ABC transporter substrate-binding protein [Anaerolineae bacterium]|nr:ABC transporter substrate-binding protein [Anaerolineae bacterium]